MSTSATEADTTQNERPFVSIVIAVARDNPNLRQCLDYCSKLDYPSFEVIVLPDEADFTAEDPRVRVVATGKVGPGEKRDRGTHMAQGSIIAFLDDDAYPTPGYLNAAAALFDDPTVAAAGGPAVTPPEDDWLQEASGWVYASPVSGGHYAYRCSKTALNMAVKSLSIDFKERGIITAVLHPGSVETETRKGGQIPVETSVSGMRTIIAGLDDTASGGFLRYDGGSIEW